MEHQTEQMTNQETEKSKSNPDIIANDTNNIDDEVPTENNSIKPLDKVRVNSGIMTVEQILFALATSSDVNRDFNIMILEGKVADIEKTKIELEKMGHFIKIQ